MQLDRLRYFAGRSSHFLLLLLFWYASCYFLMMDWRVRNYDPASGRTGDSCYYMACNVHVPGDFSVYTGSACWANLFFWPLDLAFHNAKLVMGIEGSFTDSLTAWAIWLLAFGLNLLYLPLLCAVLRRDQSAQSLKHPSLRVFLSLAAAGWYWALIVLYHSTRQEMVNVLLGKSLAVIGTVVAIAALCWIARAGRYIFVVPLAFATVTGTIWLLVSLPCAEPYL